MNRLLQITFLFLLLLSVTPAAPQTITVGSTTTQLNSTQRAAVAPYWPDGSMGGISHGGVDYIFAPSACGEGTIAISLSNLNAWSSGLTIVNSTCGNIPNGGSGSFDQNYAGGGAVYDDTSVSGYYIHLYHGEQWFGGSGSPFYASLGLAYSNSLTSSWHKLGEVISPQSARVNGGVNCQAETGVGTLVPVGTYLYSYYTDTASGCTSLGIAVARASLASIRTAISANVASGTTFSSGAGTLFMKYTGSGTWNGDGVTDLANPQNGGGAFTQIVTDSGGGGSYIPNVRYDSVSNTFIMVYIAGSSTSAINAQTSTDGVTWGNQQTLVSGGGGFGSTNQIYYPALLNTGGGDPNTLGTNFSVFYVEPFNYPGSGWAPTALYSTALSIPGGGSTITGVTVSCSPTSITTLQTSNCTSTVTGTGSFSTAVTWTATNGTVSSGGVYTPNSSGAPFTGVVTATSVQNSGFSGSANVSVTASGGGGGSCTGATPNVCTAASPNYTDVNAIINGPTHTAINGDVIQIPCSGSQAVTWASTLTVTANITITALGGTPNSGPNTFGSGANCLTITAATGTLFQFNPAYSSSNNLTTIQNMTLVPGSGAYTPIRVNGTGNSNGMPLFRVDNVQFGNGTAQWQYGTGSNTGEFDIIEDNTFGVADHNTTYPLSHNALISINLTSYLGIGLYGDNSWANPDSMGGVNNFFVENNQLYQGLWPVMENEQTYPAIGGGRAVVRFNNVTMSGTFAVNSCHGLDTDGRPRSCRHTEIYGNNMNCVNGPDGNQCYDLFIIRGGTGVFWSNRATVSGSGSPYWKEVDGISTLRAAGDGWSNVVTSAIPSPIGMGSCGDATSGNAYGPFDNNDGTQYYTGTFGAGTSGTSLVDSGSPGWTTNQWLNSGSFVYYVWDVTQGWVSRVNSNTSNTIQVQQAAHGYINGGTFINASSGDSYRIRRAKWCLDGAGVGQSALLQGTPPVLASTGLAGPANPQLDPFYEFNNSAPAITGGAQTSQIYANSIANTTYFTDNALGAPQVQTSPTSPFNGTNGVGIGTLANLPTTCTTNPVSGAPGVGYFAQDQGSWNTSGNGFGQGELFKCTSTNTWTLAYTPYQYPHPLTVGGGITPQAAAPTFTPVSPYLGGSTLVAASTSTTGCGSYIYFDTNSTPLTNQFTYSFTASTTLYAYVHGCPGYLDSSISSWVGVYGVNGPSGMWDTNLGGTNFQ